MKTAMKGFSLPRTLRVKKPCNSLMQICSYECLPLCAEIVIQSWAKVLKFQQVPQWCTFLITNKH